MKKFLTSILIALSVFTACATRQEPEQPAAAAPVLVSSSPAHNATGIAAGMLKVVLTFDVSVKCPTDQRDRISISPSGSVESVVALNQNVTVTLGGLEKATTYTLYLPSGTISGFSDNPAGDISLTFTTEDNTDPGPGPGPGPSEEDYPINPAASLSNSDASAEAVRLYNYIKDTYGRATLSGAMGGVAWSTEFDDYIYSFSGEYPAIVGFDYIHLNWSPANWIDYTDITPVKNAWEAGNIVQIGWHWCAPNTKADYEKGLGYPANGYNFSGYGFYAPGKGGGSGESSFDLGQALTEGTWQNEFLENDIRKLASNLQLLRDAGIPVLFRPLHEAAGDYQWGAWFWWGRYGAEKCKALWQHLYDELTHKYGLNNLIWVWTVQTSKEGKPAKLSDLEEWYPGDNYVDVVGADLYVDGGTSQSKVFRLVNNSVKGGKIVALSECGSLLSPDLYFEDDAPWAWFMGWGDTIPLSSSTNGWNSERNWKDALNNHYILNRDDLPNLRSEQVQPKNLGWEDAFTATANMKTGWNLGNTLDPTGGTDDWIRKWTEGKPSDWETAWGQPVTRPELMKMFKDAGFGAIRVPVSWGEKMDEEGNIDKAWMDRVEEVVNYVLDQDMYCIINVHHDTGTDGWMRASKKDYYATADRFKKLWKQIAERFASYGPKLLFESFNELLDANNNWTTPTSDGLLYTNYYNEDFVNVVRSTGGDNNFNRNLICNTYCAGGTAQILNYFDMPKDRIEGHLIAEVHSYAPYNFAMNEGAGSVLEFNSSCEKEVVSFIQSLDVHFVQNGIPCLIGEYGCTAARAGEESCKQAACYVRTAAKYGIPCFYWMSLVDGEDRDKLVWTRPDLRDAIINALK